jgi:trk system potassium uptake protein TrkA
MAEEELHMMVTIIEGGELGITLARILRLLNHRVNIVRQEKNVYSEQLKTIGVNTIFGAGVDADILSGPIVSESDLFISLMESDLDNLEACLFIKNNLGNKRTVTKVNNPKYEKKFEQIGIDIAFNGALIAPIKL